jgi:hypothetical protein
MQIIDDDDDVLKQKQTNKQTKKPNRCFFVL